MMEIVTSSDISSFELIHSGLVNTLLLYLTATDKKDGAGSALGPSDGAKEISSKSPGGSVTISAGGDGGASSSSAADDLVISTRSSSAAAAAAAAAAALAAASVAASSSSVTSGVGASPINGGVGGAVAPVEPAVVANIVKTAREERLRNFLHVFLGCSVS